MKKLFIILITFNIGFLNAQHLKLDWAKQFTGVSQIHSMTIDEKGNIYSIGAMGDTVDFDPGAGTFNLMSGGRFISKLDSSGNFVWAKEFIGVNANSVITDKSGNVYSIGSFSGITDFDPGPNVYNLPIGGTFILKLNSSGSFVWAKQLKNIVGYSLTRDEFNNMYITGNFSGTADFDPGTGVFNLVDKSGNDIFVLKIDSNGNFVWVKQIEGENCAGNSIVLDASRNIYTTGHFYGTTDFDPGTGTSYLTSGGIFISKLDSSGNFSWAKQFEATSAVSASIQVDLEGNVYTTGHFANSVDFDPGTEAFNLTSSGERDIFISKLNANGNFVWAKQIGGLFYDRATQLVIDAKSNVYSVGYFKSKIDFDPGISVYNLTSTGDFDIYISKLDASGNFVWAKKMGGPFEDIGNSIAINTSGNIITSGSFIGTADFDPESSTFNLSAKNKSNAYINKMSQYTLVLDENKSKAIKVYPNPAIGEINIELNQSLSNGSIKLLSITGKVLIEKVNISGNSFTIDLEGQVRGIYFMEISHKGLVFRDKIVKY
jgi:hypothetical protein